MDNPPQWIIDVQAEAKKMGYGRIPMEFVVANGEIGKSIGSSSTHTKFRSFDRDQKTAKIWVLDKLNTLEGDGTITISVVHHGSTITQVNTFDTIENNYEI